MSTTMMLAACGGTKDAGQSAEALICKSDIKIEGMRMTPEALWAMGRIGELSVSPDNKQIVYSVAYYSVSQNKSNRELFVMNADGSDTKQITHTPYQENAAVWIKNGTKIAFLSNDNGSSQIYEMNPDGSGRRQLTNYDGDIEGFSISPDGKKCRNKKLYPPERFTKENMEKVFEENRKRLDKAESQKRWNVLVEAIYLFGNNARKNNTNGKFPLTKLEGEALKEYMMLHDNEGEIDWSEDFENEADFVL